MKNNLFWSFLLIGLLNFFHGSILAEQTDSDFGIILVVDYHCMLNSELEANHTEVIIDAAFDGHEQITHIPSTPNENWHLLTTPSTFFYWVNVSTGYPSTDLRRFEYRSDPTRFPDWALTNNTVIHWKLTQDSSLQQSSDFLIKVFSQPALSRRIDPLFGPDFEIRLVPSWAYYLIRRADLLSSEQAYVRIRRFMQHLESSPIIAQIVSQLWDEHGVWLGYHDTLNLQNPYPLQPSLVDLSLQEIAQRDHSAIAQVLYSLRYRDNVKSAPRGDLQSYLTKILADMPQLLQANLWRALSSQEKFAAILALIEKISTRLPPRFRHAASGCWLNPDLDGILSSTAIHFEKNPVAARIFCWVLTSCATGLPQFIQDWLLMQDLSQFSN